MNYQASLTYLNQFINLEKLTYRPDHRLYNLDRMNLLLELFDHPEKQFSSVIIAGTKGKGSTGFFLESILKAAGRSVGFYNSPHLLEPTERIRVNGKNVSEADWVWGVSTIKQRLSPLKVIPATEPPACRSGRESSLLNNGSRVPACRTGRKPGINFRLFRDNFFREFTYFEILTLLAILIFAKKKVQVGIFEVGMGGRLDATNVLKAPLAILTPISFDHEALLGNTLAAIACEKAGVIHQGTKVIVGDQPKEALKVILDRARKMKAEIFFAQGKGSYKLGLKGEHQQANAALAVKAAEFFKVSRAAIQEGLLASDWSGRYQTIAQSPEVVIDAAHNPASVQVLADYLKKAESGRRKILIFGTSRDKNYREMLATLSKVFSTVILTSAKHSRSRETADLVREAQPLFKTIIPAENTEEAFRLAKRLALPKDLIVATGSFFMIGEISKLVGMRVSEYTSERGFARRPAHTHTR